MDDHSDHSDHDHGNYDDHYNGNYYDVETQSTSSLTARQWHIIALVTLPLLAAIGICSSVLLARCRNSLALVCSTMFAAGILIATGLTATLPEAEEIISQLRQEGHDIAGDFPLSYTLFGASFLLMIFIDTVVERWSENFAKKEDCEESEEIHCDHEKNNHEETGFSMKDVEQHNTIHSCHSHMITQTAKPWAGILLTLIISIHSVLECVVIGSVTEVDIMTSSYIAVAMHKVFDGFTLGTGLVASGYWSKQRRKFIYLSTLYVLLNLISVGIGMALSTAFSGDSIVIAVLLSLVGGSFLFIGTVEFVPVELQKMRELRMPVLPIMFSLCAGFAAMTLVTKFAHDHH